MLSLQYKIQELIDNDHISKENSIEDLLFVLDGGELEKHYFIAHYDENNRLIIGADIGTTSFTEHTQKMNEVLARYPDISFGTHVEFHRPE